MAKWRLGRPNTLLAQIFDLKVFFAVVDKAPLAVGMEDMLGFIESQRALRRGQNVIRLADGESQLAASTIERRLATVSSLLDHLLLRGVCDRNPVPRSIGARHHGHRGVPLVRVPKRLPRVLSAPEVSALTSVLRTDRDLGDVHVGDHANAWCTSSRHSSPHRPPTHASIKTIRLYLHLSNDWLSSAR